ncbi:hypothetical protein FRC10_008948 [Ceratobasidium sp. 414]|nr:hypothetical protein FRC10_008948 [Ceratobasidium sp. 414]
MYTPLPDASALDSPMQCVFPPPPVRWAWFGMVDFKHSNFLFGRPTDLVIHTRDLETFFAHRAVLAFTSEKLASLVRASVNGVIYLPEELPGAVCALLEWPKKYQLDAMRDALLSMLRQPGSPVNISAHPVRTYGLATSHGLASEAQGAARLAVGKIDFRKEGELEELGSMGVSAVAAFWLMQRQLAWESALMDVLPGASTPSCYSVALTLEEREWEVLVCAKCISWDKDDVPTGMVQWQRNWAERVYERLVCTPLKDWCTGRLDE